MTAQALAKKIDREIKELRGDVQEIQQFIFGPHKDTEGEYRESFIRRLFKRSLSSGPFYKFTDRESFLRHVRGKK